MLRRRIQSMFSMSQAERQPSVSQVESFVDTPNHRRSTNLLVDSQVSSSNTAATAHVIDDEARTPPTSALVVGETQNAATRVCPNTKTIGSRTYFVNDPNVSRTETWTVDTAEVCRCNRDPQLC